MSTAEPLTPEARHDVLTREIAKQARHGWRVQSQSTTQATLLKGKHTSHLLHLVLTLITLGVRGIVWILIAVFGGEKSKLISVDEQGRVRTSS